MIHSADTLWQPRAGTLPARVVQFFSENPDEELTSGDIANKFGAMPHSVATALSRPVEHGLLQRRKDTTVSGRVGYVYTAGHRTLAGEFTITGHAAAPDPDDPEDSGVTATRLPHTSGAPAPKPKRARVDLSAITIEPGIPIPKIERATPTRWPDVLAKMAVGDSFALPATGAAAARKAVSADTKATGRTYTVHSLPADTIRIWRTA